MRKYDHREVIEMMRAYAALAYAQIEIHCLDEVKDPKLRTAILRNTLETVIPRYQDKVTLLMRQQLEIDESDLMRRCKKMIDQWPV